MYKHLCGLVDYHPEPGFGDISYQEVKMQRLNEPHAGNMGICVIWFSGAGKIVYQI